MFPATQKNVLDVIMEERSIFQAVNFQCGTYGSSVTLGLCELDVGLPQEKNYVLDSLGDAIGPIRLWRN